MYEIKKFGKRLRTIRKSENLIFKDFEKETKVAQSILNKTENGVTEMKLKTLMKIIMRYPQYSHYLLFGNLDYLDIQKIPGDGVVI